MTTRFAHLNGRLLPLEEASVSILDHGLLYGDGLFETLRVYDRGYFRMDAHLARMADGARRLDLELPWAPGVLADAIRETVLANGVQNGAVRLTVTRGAGAPIPDPAACPSPSVFVTVRHGVGAADLPAGIGVCAAGHHPQTWVPGIKSLSYLPFQQARWEARRSGYDDGLLFAGELLIESSAANLFVFSGGKLRTPGLDSGCLAGITRAAILELARWDGTPVREEPLPLRSLADCDEAFLTNSFYGITPIAATNYGPTGTRSPGGYTRWLFEAYTALVARELAP